MRGTFLYIGQRLVLIAITTVLVSSIVFILLHQIPGNAFLNETRTSPQALAADMRHYGLDKQLQTRYINWVGGVLHGCPACCPGPIHRDLARPERTPPNAKSLVQPTGCERALAKRA